MEKRVDSQPGDMSIFSAWNALIHQMAVLAASATALVSLLWKTPVSVACLRGGAAWLGLILVGKLVGVVLSKVDRLDGQALARKVQAESAKDDGELPKGEAA